MPAGKKKPIRKSSATETPAPEERVGEDAGEFVKSVAKPAAKRKAVAPPVTTAVVDTPVVLVPATPEAKKSGGHKRKRLSKVFSRPLDKKLKKEALVRERFTIPSVEYVQFALLKKRLSDQGRAIKKSELVRAGLALLSSLGDEDLKQLMATVQPAE